MERTICPWAAGELYIAYHDEEWGKPLHNDQMFFEMLILEGMQAGLSWLTVLKKREAFREAFDHFDPVLVAQYGEEKRAELLGNPLIIRNRAKIAAATINAQAFLEIQKEFGSFDRFIWAYVDGKPLVNHWETVAEVPASTALSDRLSADLKKRGFKFAGTTICYSFLQATGLINDHLVGCDQYHNCEGR